MDEAHGLNTEWGRSERWSEGFACCLCGQSRKFSRVGDEDGEGRTCWNSSGDIICRFCESSIFDTGDVAAAHSGPISAASCSTMLAYVRAGTARL